jgi:hypothetical protein
MREVLIFLDEIRRVGRSEYASSIFFEGRVSLDLIVVCRN